MTNEEMIQELEDIKLKQPQFSIFGDNNWTGIDLCKKIIEDQITDEDEVEFETEDSRLSDYEATQIAIGVVTGDNKFEDLMEQLV